MEELYVDATGTSIGRIGTYASKQALQGKNIIILNSEKAIITGNKENAIEKYKRLRVMGGSALKGPYISKVPERLLKRAIRGMLPDYRNGRGRDAWKKIKCYSGVPEEFKDAKLQKITSKKLPVKHITLKELQERL